MKSKKGNQMKLIPLASNQTEVKFENNIYVFFSYRTPVAAFVPGMSFIRTKEKYSRTTSKHINKWLASSGANRSTVTEVDQSVIDNLVGAC